MKDCNGAKLNDGDSVELTEDIEIGQGVILKKGSQYHKIKCWYNKEQAEADALINGKFVQLVIKTEKLKKI